MARDCGALAFDSVLGRCIVAWTERGVVELHLPDPADRLRRLGRGAARGKTGRKKTGRGKAARGKSGRGAEENPGRFAEAEGRLKPVRDPKRAPTWVRRLVRRIAAHLSGRLDDFHDVPIDLPADASAFDLAIWDAARQVPPGLTITYGEIADEIGHPGAARAAGSAMRRCPVTLLIPAHRVIAAGRRPGGWTGPGGVTTKLMLLEIEGVELTRPVAKRRRAR